MSDQALPLEATQALTSPTARLPARLRRFFDKHQALATAVTVEPRPTDPQLVRYVRSYLIMRIVVGALGVALPVWLVFGDERLGGTPVPRDSLSAYYYSGARELFVGVLAAIAVFLVCYRVAERSWDNGLSLLAGGAVLTVAVFPTGPPAHVEELTPLQNAFGVQLVQTIHFTAAGVFIVSLGVISFFFGVREGSRPREEGQRCSRRFWRNYHWFWAGAILMAVLWIGATELTDGLAIWEPSKSLLIGEWVAVWAFGASWLLKGMERDMLRRGKPQAADTSADVAVSRP
jgi:hypothetical protein